MTSTPRTLAAKVWADHVVVTRSEHIHAQPNLPIAATTVLPYCTLEPPLSLEALTVLSDIYPTMRGIASMQSEGNVWAMTDNGMCKAEAEACLEFWKDEYLAE